MSLKIFFSPTTGECLFTFSMRITEACAPCSSTNFPAFFIYKNITVRFPVTFFLQLYVLFIAETRTGPESEQILNIWNNSKCGFPWNNALCTKSIWAFMKNDHKRAVKLYSLLKVSTMIILAVWGILTDYLLKSLIWSNCHICRHSKHIIIFAIYLFH